jgi:DNA-binding transcriptional LysR family regulator
MRLTPRATTLLEPVKTMLAQVEALVSREQAFDPATTVRTFRFGLPDSMEILIMPALLARMREVAPGIHLRLYNIDPSRLLDDLDADVMDIAIFYEPLREGQLHHKRRKLFTETFLCVFNAEKTGITPPISLDDYVRLPHVLTSMGPGRSARLCGRCAGEARFASVRRAHDATLPHRPVSGGPSTRHRHHGVAPGATVLGRARTEPEPATGEIE